MPKQRPAVSLARFESLPVLPLGQDPLTGFKVQLELKWPRVQTRHSPQCKTQKKNAVSHRRKETYEAICRMPRLENAPS